MLELTALVDCEGQKRCSVCWQRKLLADFSKDRTQRNGLCPSCRVCRSACMRGVPVDDLRPPEAIAEREAKKNRTEKPCSSCGLVKPLSEFHKNAHSVDGRHSWCKECHSAIGKARWQDPDERALMEKRSIDWNKANPEAVAANKVRQGLKRFGLTAEAYEKLVAAAGGVCQICGNPPPGGQRLVPDHDHRCCPGGSGSCGRCVRGVLCSPCNRSIGGLGDTAQAVRLALRYLEEWEARFDSAS